MSGLGDVTGAERRAQLEQRADGVRSRLEERLEALDERKDRLRNILRSASKPPLSVVLIGAASLLATGLLVRKFRSRRPNFAERLRRIMELSEPRRPEGVIARTLKRSALSLLTTGAQRLAYRGLDRVLADPTVSAPLPARKPTIPRPEPR